MNYQQALAYIHSLARFGSKPGLERIQELTARLGNPQNHLKFIHVAGTNGKGSTASFITGVLSAAGYSTGLYTSPFVVRFNERIRYNGNDISDTELAQYVSRIKKVIDMMEADGLEHPTEFEVITALAFLYYYEKKCDVVVLEVGLGGRYDATNIIPCPLIAVITKIAMDHMEILGETLSEIAYEKAGIIKQRGTVVTYPQHESALKVIETVCRQMDAKLFYADADGVTDIALKPGLLHFRHPQLGIIETPIVGVHQVNNALVALKTVEALIQHGYQITPDDIRNGFRNTTWLGRFELLQKAPDFYIDAAHNPDGIRSFIDTFKKVYPGKKAIVIFGVMKDKEYPAMLEALSEITERFIAITPDTPRALPAQSLINVMSKYCKNVEYSDTIKEAVEKSILIASENDVIAALGSLYYIGQVRSLFTKN